jgi:hypothetical protein
MDVVVRTREAGRMNDEHVWFRSHLADRLLDLLDERDVRRLEEHASGCAACGAMLARARAERIDWWDGKGHIPVGVLALWTKDPTLIPEVALPLVRAHLSACAACAQDLAELGGEAEGANTAGGPLDNEVGKRGGRTLAVARSHPFERRIDAPARHWQDWAAGAVLGALATAAALLVVWPHVLRQPALRAPSSRTAPNPAPPTPIPQALATGEPLLGLAEPVSVVPASREGGTDTTRIAVLSGRVLVPLSLPELFLGERVPLKIELLDRRGEPVANLEMPAAAAMRRGGVVFDTRAVPDGAYTLRLSWRDRSLGALHRDYPLDLRPRR